LISQKLDFTYEEIDEATAKEMFTGQPYKLELISEIAERGEKLSIYRTGDFVDLCAGPHVANTSEINVDAFEISKLAGAYWRGDENKQMLTRIYGLAFATADELEAYKKNIAEAINRDHRKIGKELDLFTSSELVGPGLPLFTPKGTAMREAIVNKISSIQERFGFERVTIPHITKPDLYKVSGHWEKFADQLFKVQGRETEFVMKPMNCPHHTQIYASSPKSYKELPIRYAENTMVYRDEQSGELLGLSRVRCLTQDDGHIFCTPDQVETEIKNIIEIIKEFYTSLGLWTADSRRVYISLRDEKTPEKFIGSDENWNNSEKILKQIATENGLEYTIEEGGAAFYGPKIDFKFLDAIGREWQLATLQLDFNMPTRFGLEYTDNDGHKKTPVMIHRAIAGSLERFMSVIIEHFAGNFPLWLSPVQVKIVPVMDSHYDQALKLHAQLKKEGIRVETDLGNDSLGKKVRNAKKIKVNYVVVLGDKEIESNTVSIEDREENKQTISVFDFINLLKSQL